MAALPFEIAAMKSHTIMSENIECMLAENAIDYLPSLLAILLEAPPLFCEKPENKPPHPRISISLVVPDMRLAS